MPSIQDFLTYLFFPAIVFVLFAEISQKDREIVDLRSDVAVWQESTRRAMRSSAAYEASWRRSAQHVDRCWRTFAKRKLTTFANTALTGTLAAQLLKEWKEPQTLEIEWTKINKKFRSQRCGTAQNSLPIRYRKIEQIGQWSL